MKKIIKLLIILPLLFVLTGCQDKKALNADEITKKMGELGFLVSDGTEMFEDEDIIKVLSFNNGKYQIEYHEYKTEEKAKESYKGNKNYFDLEAKKGKETSKKNYDKYVQSAKEEYHALTRVGNTFLYVSASIEYKDEIEKVLKELNY